MIGRFVSYTIEKLIVITSTTNPAASILRGTWVRYLTQSTIATISKTKSSKNRNRDLKGSVRQKAKKPLHPVTDGDEHYARSSHETARSEYSVQRPNMVAFASQ